MFYKYTYNIIILLNSSYDTDVTVYINLLFDNITHFV